MDAPVLSDALRNDDQAEIFRQLANTRLRAIIIDVSPLGSGLYCLPQQHVMEWSVHDAIYNPRRCDATMIRGHWIHLTANNVNWIHDLMKKLKVGYGDVRDSRDRDTDLRPSISTSFRKPQEHDKLRNSLRCLFVRPSPLSRSLLPSTLPGTFPLDVTNLTNPQMPILGYETHGNRKRLARAFKETYEGPRPKSHEHERRETQCTANEALLLGYQATRYPAYPRRRQVHPRQTLQRFGYSMITSTEARDRDQVSFRWAAAVGGRRLRKKSFRPVIMVDQLWLWMLEDGTLITCCPEASALGWISDQRTRGDLSGSNLSRLYDLGLLAGSGTEVMTQVVSHLVLRELIDFGGKWGPMDFRFEDGFRASINRIVRPASTDPHLTPMPIDDHSTCQVEHENSLFRRFTAATRLSHEASGNGAKENDDDFLNRSDLETNLLVELMAIQDELNIIQTVLTQQRTVLEELRRIYQGSRSKQNGDFDCLLGRQLDGEDEKSRNLELMRGTFEVLDKNAAVVEHLLADAAKVQRSVESLLTFKQMHANTAEARLRRKKEETAERSENTLKAFGLISLLFLPLSFASSLFALDVDVFPKDEAGEKSWPIRQVMGLIFGISAAILVILVTSSVFINEILAFSRHWRQSLLTSISITTTANPPNTTSEPARPAHDSDSDSDPETLYSSDSTSELSSSDGEYESDSVISSSLSEEEEESAAAAGSSAAPPPRSSSAGDIQPDSVVGSSDPEEEEKGSEHVPAAESSTQPPTPPPAPVPLLMSAVDRLRRRGRRQEAAIDVDVEKGVVSSAGKQEVGGSLQ